MGPLKAGKPWNIVCRVFLSLKELLLAQADVSEVSRHRNRKHRRRLLEVPQGRISAPPMSEKLQADQFDFRSSTPWSVEEAVIGREPVQRPYLRVQDTTGSASSATSSTVHDWRYG